MNRSEIIERARSGSISGADLSYADLSDADLSGATLRVGNRTVRLP